MSTSADLCECYHLKITLNRFSTRRFLVNTSSINSDKVPCEAWLEVINSPSAAVETGKFPCCAGQAVVSSAPLSPIPSQFRVKVCQGE